MTVQLYATGDTSQISTQAECKTTVPAMVCCPKYHARISTTHPGASDLELGRMGGLVVLDLYRLGIAAAHARHPANHRVVRFIRQNITSEQVTHISKSQQAATFQFPPRPCYEIVPLKENQCLLQYHLRTRAFTNAWRNKIKLDENPQDLHRHDVLQADMQFTPFTLPENT